MALRTYVIALAVAVGTMLVGSLSAVTPAAAQGWYRHHHHHYYGWGGPHRCWTEFRMVRVHTPYGWRVRERPVRICR
jgi:hypothetical protein